ncbi:transcriptional regulator [Streptomyces viridochromogenes DSM 40736]|uniref:Transcriptional regulator n=1 Tax=Streptomyces viridochromogenes (strain DSM 40736 / JCM 4977 / BCRC 1201 / Tue 494) TaxID=591159 RepID=D9X7N0_STRVT|nr:metalloregulator ArsR/SmtB family transcription factor [Streptomyces viridochromogenes]EFL29926.1 transcriptional regulator [Streptomyces viridochromogenes DSM 40736]
MGSRPADAALAPPEFVRLAAHPLRWRLLAELADGDHRVRELVERVGEPQNLVSYHLRLLRDGGLVTARRSSFDGRDTYYHLDLERCTDALAASGAALHPALRQPPSSPSSPVGRARGRRLAVLFVCTGNGARSPIAEALLRHHTAGRVTAVSAGTSPQPQLHPHTVRVLRESFGIDLSGRRTQHVDDLVGRRFDHVITLCDKAREICPEFGPRRVHWSMADPGAAAETGEAGYAAFQHVAADIDTRVRHLMPVLNTPETVARSEP